MAGRATIAAEMHLSALQTLWARFNTPDALWPLFLEAVVGMAIGCMIGILVRIYR